MEEAAWVGKAVSIQCNDNLGVFQGTIKDLSSTQLTIVRAFRNGVPLRKQDAEVTLSICDIQKLDLIPHSMTQTNVGTALINNPTPVKQPNYAAATSRESALTHKMSNMKINGVHQRRSPTQETKSSSFSSRQQHLQQHQQPIITKSPSNSSVARFFGSMMPSTVEVKMVSSPNSTATTTVPQPTECNGRSSSKPIDIVASMAKSAPTNNATFRQERKKSRWEARNNKNHTFGTPIDDPTMVGEFDFEGNLALFDKQAIWDEIEAGQKPDLVRQTLPSQQKYRHDENVISSLPTQLRQIDSGCQSTNEFVTDEGLIIPAIPIVLRKKIQRLAEKRGLSLERQCDMLARGTSDLAILLAGGARRMNPNNEHQWPTITIFCDRSQNAKASELAAATGRQLASHGLKVILYIKDEAVSQKSPELELFKATGNRIVLSVNDLPSSDLVILSVSSDNALSPSIKKWIKENRSSVLAIDPPPTGISNVQIKCSIVPILPLNNISQSCGKLYLCNLSIPDKFFQESGVTYKSPFGHKFVIPIHMKD